MPKIEIPEGDSVDTVLSEQEIAEAEANAEEIKESEKRFSGPNETDNSINKAFAEAGLGFEISSADEEGEPDEWLMEENFLVKNKVNLLAADGGTGKTTLSAFLAKKLSDEGKSVLYWSYEDDKAAMAQKVGIVPNLKFLDFSGGVMPDTTTEKGCKAIEEVFKICAKNMPNLSLIVIDPISASCGDSNKANVVQGMLNLFRNLAKELEVTILGIHHINKGNAMAGISTQKALDKVTGSRAWTNTPRHVLMMDRNEAKGEVFIEVVKTNTSGEKYTSWRFVAERDPHTNYFRGVGLSPARNKSVSRLLLKQGIGDNDDPFLEQLIEVFGTEIFSLKDIRDANLRRSWDQWTADPENAKKWALLPKSEWTRTGKGSAKSATYRLNIKECYKQVGLKEMLDEEPTNKKGDE